MWFFGDEFGFHTFEKHFYQRDVKDYGGYTKEHYEVSGFMNNRTLSLDTNTVSRLHNVLISAITDKKKFAKIAVFVPDDDIINYMDIGEDGVRDPFGKVVDWLMTQHERIIMSWKEYLPVKAKNSTYPQILWIEPPVNINFHNNAEREKFAKSMNNAVRYHDNMHVLKLKKIWDEDDTTLFVKETNRFTTNGIKKYWEVVDKTVRFADTILLRKDKKQQNKAVNQKLHKEDVRCDLVFNKRRRNDYHRYHWSSKA